jgi:hypothetical protein
MDALAAAAVRQDLVNFEIEEESGPACVRFHGELPGGRRRDSITIRRKIIDHQRAGGTSINDPAHLMETGFESVSQPCILSEEEQRHMRWLVSLIGICVITAGILACNSNETLLSQKPANQAAAPAGTPADAARRIGVEELHKLWQSNDVYIIDTRAESAYKMEHIKGSVSMPTGTVLDHLNDLPKSKLIAAYCT